MPTPIRMPEMGTTVDQVKLVAWLKQEGDAVKRGDILCEVETDKAVNGLESIADGVVLKLLFREGSEIRQGAIVAYVGKEGETAPEDAAGQEEQDRHAGSDARPATHMAMVPPVIRNLAKKEGVSLDGVVGTGPGGRITREDVLKLKLREPAAGTPLSANQQVVAKRVVRSQREIPPIHLSGMIDMSAVMAERERLKAAGRKISFDAFLLRAVAVVMVEFPHFRSRLVGERVVDIGEVVPSIAIDAGRDLFVPVIRGVVRMTLGEVEQAIRGVQEKARHNRLTREDLEGATLTVSNLGMYPVRSFNAVIPPDQAAILAVGAIESTPVVREGAVAVAPMAVVTLSVDHRLINGREAAEFLAAVKKELERL